MVPPAPWPTRCSSPTGISCGAGGRGRGTAVANLGSLPLADVAVGDDALLLASGPGGAAVRAGPRRVAGADGQRPGRYGSRSLEIGVDYVKERHAFGVPIGSFQAIAHGLADAATASTAVCSWPGRRPGRRGRSRIGRPSWPRWPSPSTPRRPARPAIGACTTTAGTASCSSTTSSSTSAGPRRGRRVFGEPALAYARARGPPPGDLTRGR